MVAMDLTHPLSPAFIRPSPTVLIAASQNGQEPVVEQLLAAHVRGQNRSRQTFVGQSQRKLGPSDRSLSSAQSLGPQLALHGSEHGSERAAVLTSAAAAMADRELEKNLEIESLYAKLKEQMLEA